MFLQANSDFTDKPPQLAAIQIDALHYNYVV